MKSIHDLKKEMHRNWYGSSKRVYRQCDVDKLLEMWIDLKYLNELHTRARLLPCNEEFLKERAIPAYNRQLSVLKSKYPNIIEFQRFRYI